MNYVSPPGMIYDVQYPPVLGGRYPIMKQNGPNTKSGKVAVFLLKYLVIQDQRKTYGGSSGINHVVRCSWVRWEKSPKGD